MSGKVRKYIAGGLLGGLFLLVSPAVGQVADAELRARYRSTMIGVGGAQTYDTYLSPLSYTGSGLGVWQEWSRNLRWLEGHANWQQLLNINGLATYNNTGTAADLSLFAEYSTSLFYRYRLTSNLSFDAGPQVAAMLGGLYNTRNGNNPTSIKANLNLGLSGATAYRMRLGNFDYVLRYQLEMPLAGVLFAPAYGQSYYEIGLGKQDGLVHFASPHNQLAMRNTLSVEMELKKWSLRLGFVNRVYETQVNQKDTRLMTNMFYLGISRTIYTK